MSADITGFQRMRRIYGEAREENTNPDPGLNTYETATETMRPQAPTNSLTAEEPSEAKNLMELADREFRDAMPKASVLVEGGTVVGNQEKRDRFMAEMPESYDAQDYALPSSVTPGTDGTGPKDEVEGKKQADEGHERQMKAGHASDLGAGAQEFTKQLSKERLAMGGTPVAPAGGEGEDGMAGFVETKSGDAVPESKAEELPAGEAIGDDSADTPSLPVEEPVEETTNPNTPDFDSMTKAELGEYAQDYHGVTLDQRKSKENLLAEVKKLAGE